jgi:hypothetical protein
VCLGATPGLQNRSGGGAHRARGLGLVFFPIRATRPGDCACLPAALLFLIPRQAPSECIVVAIDRFTVTPVLSCCRCRHYP